MPAPVQVRNSGPLVRPSMTACTAGKAGRGTGHAGGLVAVADEGQHDVPADSAHRINGQSGHLAGPQPQRAAEDGDGVMVGPSPGGGKEGGVLQHGEHLPACSSRSTFGRAIRAHGLMAMRFSSKASR